MIFVVQGRGSWLFPRELQSPSPGGHCSSSPPPPTQKVQSPFETASPLTEGMLDDESDLDACRNRKLINMHSVAESVSIYGRS